jgi:hypothetical protein
MNQHHRTACTAWRAVALALAGTLAGASPAHALDLFGNGHQEAVCRALAVVRGLPAPALLAMQGKAEAFDPLRAGNAELSVVLADPRLGESLRPSLQHLQARTRQLLAQREPVLDANRALDELAKHAMAQLELGEIASSLALQEGARPADANAIGVLLMLSQRIGKSAREFVRADGLDPEAVFLLGKDLKTSSLIIDGLLHGSAELRLSGRLGPPTRAALERLAADLEVSRKNGERVLSRLKELVAARDAQASIASDAAAVDHALAPVCMSR